MPRFNAQPGPNARAHRGTSLIEILVVLVILVVGILSIVRLFPAGFIALRDAQDASFADRLAQSALEQLKKDNAGLPDAIYMYDANLGGFNPNIAPDDFYSYVPDSTGANTSHSFGTLASFANDINKQRYISNETITVPAVRMTNASSALPLYAVNHGPIDLSVPLTVVSAPWIGQPGASRINPSDPTRSIDNPTDILQPGQQKFLVDLNSGQIAVPSAAYTQKFILVVQGSPATTGGPPAAPVSITLNVPVPTSTDPAPSNWFNPATTYAATTANPAPTLPWLSATLVRPFTYEGVTNASTNFDADPYEYAIYSDNLSSTFNIGVLTFNPLASGQNGTQPLQARISYRTLDWHILHEDQDVVAGSPTIRLTLNHLKKIGDVQFDQSTFNGLIPNAAASSDLMLLNLDTGQLTQLAEPESGDTSQTTFDVDNNNGNGTSTTAAGKQYQVSYLNGRITFPMNSPGGHYRVFYAGDADWALAIQKAANMYAAASSASTLSQAGGTPNNYYYDSSQAAATADKVYFPICDEGKTVEFDGISYKDANGAAQQIGEASASISTAVDTNGLPYVNLTSSGLNPSNILPNGDSLVTSSSNPSMPFSAVRGVSASAVVIWHEHNTWHTRKIDTLLTQSQTPSPTL